MFNIVEDCHIDKTTTLWHHCNLYRCHIGAHCEIGCFVEIGEGVTIGNHCKILTHTFIPPGVTIGNRVFIGPHVTFSNDKHPTVVQKDVVPTVVEDDVSIGANCTILCGITLKKKMCDWSGKHRNTRC